MTPDGGSLGGVLTTDANGSVTGTFAIPDPNVDSNPRWRTGKRVFRLTGFHLQIVEIEQMLTSAEADYVPCLLETTQKL